jgi:hypothetical protein
MMSERILVTTDKAQELLALLRNHPKAPVGPCLSDRDFDAYVTESLGPDEVGELDRHLESCTACAIAMERRLEEAGLDAHLQSELNDMLQDEDPGIRQLASQALAYLRPAPALVVEHLGDDQDAGAILPIIPGSRWVVLAHGVGFAATTAQTAVAAKTSRGWQTGGTLGDRLKSKYRENDLGGLEIYLASKSLRDGLSLTLKAGTWVKDIVLHRVRPDQVGAKVVISREERSDIPRGADLTTDLPPQQSNDEGPGQAD